MGVSWTRQSFYLPAYAEVFVERPEIDECMNDKMNNSLIRMVTADLQVMHTKPEEVVPKLDTMLMQNARDYQSVVGMSFSEFKQMLKDRGVDVEEFGTGDAKTLREFYNDVVIDRDSYL